MQNKTLFLMIIFFMVQIPKTTAMDCEKYPQLGTKRYNQVAQLLTHNSTAHTISLVQNQDLTLSEQLAAGANGFKIPVHFNFTNKLTFYYKLLNARITEIIQEIKATNNKLKILELDAEKDAAKIALETLTKLGASTGERIPYACHALPKNELYINLGTDIINAMPTEIQSILGKYANTLNNTYLKLLTDVLGQPNQSLAAGAGGIIPWTPCIIDWAAKPLRTYLSEIKNYLDTHQKAVVTLIIDNYITVYDAIKNEIQEANVLSYAYKQPVNQTWPTLTDLISNGKRLVIFMNATSGDTLDNNGLDWANKLSEFALGSQYNFKTVQDLETSLQGDNQIFSNLVNPQTCNQFAYVQHFVTPLISGSKKDADIVNTTAIVTPRLQNIINRTNLTPFLSVDYLSKNNELVTVINHINGITS